jgi:hypothetical protein
VITKLELDSVTTYDRDDLTLLMYPTAAEAVLYPTRTHVGISSSGSRVSNTISEPSRVAAARAGAKTRRIVAATPDASGFTLSFAQAAPDRADATRRLRAVLRNLRRDDQEPRPLWIAVLEGDDDTSRYHFHGATDRHSALRLAQMWQRRIGGVDLNVLRTLQERRNWAAYLAKCYERPNRQSGEHRYIASRGAHPTPISVQLTPAKAEALLATAEATGAAIDRIGPEVTYTFSAHKLQWPRPLTDANLTVLNIPIGN